MLSRGDAVVYKCRGMYKVEEIGTLDFSFADSKKKYYTLQSIEDAKDKAYVPTDDEKNIRRPVSFEEAKHLLDCVDKIEVLSVKNEKFREQEYKDCISDLMLASSSFKMSAKSCDVRRALFSNKSRIKLWFIFIPPFEL